MVYALLVERAVGDVRVVQQSALLAAAVGGKVEIPSVESAIADLDELLAAAPKDLSPEQRELRRALGVR